METVPDLTRQVRLPLDIAVRPYLMDHRFEGKAVLPAVEAMQYLSASTRRHCPGLNVRSIENAEFSRFLSLTPDVPRIEAFNEIEVHADGRVTSRLLTRTRSRSGITRTHTHVSMEFPPSHSAPVPLPADQMFALEGIGLNVQSDKIYQSLVPFGPSFQNIQGELTVSAFGAITSVHAPDPGAPVEPLGSPFPLDAAFHAACVYGQRFSGIVGFPVGLGYRYVFQPTEPKASYLARIVPKRAAYDRLVFDIWITDMDGAPYEAVLGLIMQDVSAGRMVPPDWITLEPTEKGLSGDDPGPLSDSGTRHCVMELSSVHEPAVKALSEGEHERFNELGKRRQKSFLAARLCLKRLSRVLCGHDAAIPASSIHTLASDKIRPYCPLSDGRDAVYCSVSHDNRFVIAVASGSRVGVDVERLTEKVVKARHIYMHNGEIALTEDSLLGKISAALRVWSTKEAMAKAFDIPLAEAWDRVTVTTIGKSKSELCYDRKIYEAVHHQVGNHLFTLVDTGGECKDPTAFQQFPNAI